MNRDPSVGRLVMLRERQHITLQEQREVDLRLEAQLRNYMDPYRTICLAVAEYVSRKKD